MGLWKFCNVKVTMTIEGYALSFEVQYPVQDIVLVYVKTPPCRLRRLSPLVNEGGEKG